MDSLYYTVWDSENATITSKHSIFLLARTGGLCATLDLTGGFCMTFNLKDVISAFVLFQSALHPYFVNSADTYHS